MSISGYNLGEANKVAQRRNRSPFDFSSYCTGEAEDAAAFSQLFINLTGQPVQ